jgi:hypothetical protein
MRHLAKITQNRVRPSKEYHVNFFNYNLRKKKKLRLRNPPPQNQKS